MKSVFKYSRAHKILVIAGVFLLIGVGVFTIPMYKTAAQRAAKPNKTYKAMPRSVEAFETINVKYAPQIDTTSEPAPVSWLNVIPAPKGQPPAKPGVPLSLSETDKREVENLAPVPSTTGTSPGPLKSFKGEFLSSTSIPPDTMGAVGLNHAVNTTNDRMSITTRDGVVLSRITLNSFWAGVTIKGSPVTSTFDPKIMYDRFNDRYIFVSSAGGPSINSGALLAVTQTGDPTGNWYRYSVVSDPNSTATAGHAIDYPSLGFNKNWIVMSYNTFNFSGASFTNYYGPQIYVFDKQAAYSGAATVNLFEDPATNCTTNASLGCGFTLAPTINEENTTETVYLAEDWDSTAGQLRLSKMTGTPSAPVLTVGTQFPQSAFSWRYNAARIGTSGGYAPQRQQSANLASGTRIMTNDSRIQNAVLRNGSLWTAHTVMLSSTPTPAGTAVGGTANRDNHSGIQWWQIDPTIEDSNFSTLPIQRGRIEDPTADNCHNGNSGTVTTAPCSNSTANQVGTFFAFPNISVNKNNDTLIGFTQFSPLTYPSSAYAIRRSGDTMNAMRDPVVYRPGQANYNLGSGSGTTRQNRWGDYSAAQTDPTNDTDFWTVQEYAGTVRDFGIGLAGNWETYWSQIRPSDAPPVLNGNLIINEFRLRGPQGVRDEFVELYNPGTTPVYVNTTDNSDGWALVYSANGTTATGIAVIPNGTVIPAKGHFLIVDNPDGANGPTVTYSLNGYPSNGNRTSDSDTGWSLDLADNGGLALFKTANTANFNVANRMDSVGFTGIAAGLFKEGAGIPNLTSNPTTNFSFYRDLSGGTPKDTQDNAADFLFVDVNGTNAGAGQRLGAPGPENLDDPIEDNAELPVSLIDSTQAADASPNQVSDPTAVTNGTNGTVSVRRSVYNNTKKPIVRLRFRITTLSTFPNNPDYRLLTSPTITVSTNDTTICGSNPKPCSVQVNALTLEEPPAQPNGGGYNSSVYAAAITFNTPLPPYARFNVNFQFGVNSGVPLRRLALAPQVVVPFTVNVAAVLQQPLAPTAASVVVNGRVLTRLGYGVSNATVKMTSQDGEVRTARTNAFGYFKIDGALAGETYVFTASAKRYRFVTQVLQVNENLDDLNFISR